MKSKLIYQLLVAIMISFSFLSCIAPRRGPQKAYNKALELVRNRPFDAIIVPGTPFRNSNWDTIMKARVLWSWILYKEGVTKNVIYSGGAVYSPYKEAVIMGLYAQQLGIPAEHIFYDTQARHSTENVFYSYLLARKLGFKSLALATDPFQSSMLKGFLRKRFGSPIYRLPFVVDTLAVYNSVSPKIDPTEAKVDDFVSITSNESFLKRIRGTMGRNIDWTPYDKGQLPPL